MGKVELPGHMPDRSLAHIAYVVQDMDRALKRFRKEGAEILVPPTQDPVQEATVALLEIDGGVKLELVAPLPDGTGPMRARLERGGGLDHLCYVVDALDDALAAEEAAGALVVRAPSFARAFGRHVAFVQRRSGLVLELMTREETTPDGERD